MSPPQILCPKLIANPAARWRWWCCWVWRYSSCWIAWSAKLAARIGTGRVGRTFLSDQRSRRISQANRQYQGTSSNAVEGATLALVGPECPTHTACLVDSVFCGVIFEVYDLIL